MSIAKIRFGNVFIQDLNNNNRYDKDVDLVTDRADKPVDTATKYKAFHRVFRDLHVHTWRGLSLHHASEYLRLLDDAERASISGRVESLEQDLRRVRQVLLRLPTRYDSKWFNLLHKNALIKGIDVRFDEAEAGAKSGQDIERTKAAMIAAASYVAKLNHQFGMQMTFDQARANLLLSEAYEKGVPQEYLEAGRMAQSGDIEATRSLLTQIQGHIQEAYRDYHLPMIDDPKEGERLMIQAYRAKISKGYDEAMREALREKPSKAREILTRTQKYIQEANQKYKLGLVFDQAKADEISAVGNLP